jgi:hypothetical protein
MRRAARVDANHSGIINAFRKYGCSVLDTSQLGGGAPDIIVGRWMRCVCVEIKDGEKVPSARKLTPLEIKFKREWKGAYALVENLDDVHYTVKHFLS